tara:strand:+ start:1517 stop:1852 length:336 start_codon:yes stop_codon:yes gene_type:complete
MAKKILKPWGYEEIIELNKYYCLKKLFMKKNHRCSLQYHNKKIETIIVVRGKLKVIIKNKIKIFKQGDIFTIRPKTVHRMEAIKGNCTYLESSSVHLKDVIRLQDDYFRKK